MAVSVWLRVDHIENLLLKSKRRTTTNCIGVLVWWINLTNTLTGSRFSIYSQVLIRSDIYSVAFLDLNLIRKLGRLNFQLRLFHLRISQNVCQEKLNNCIYKRYIHGLVGSTFNYNSCTIITLHRNPCKTVLKQCRIKLGFIGLNWSVI